QLVRGTGRHVANDVQVDLELVDGAERVAHALALLEARAACREREDVGALSPRGAFEAQARAGAVLEEQRSDGEALQGRDLLDGPGQHLRHDLGRVEQRDQLVGTPVGEVEQVAPAGARGFRGWSGQRRWRRARQRGSHHGLTSSHNSTCWDPSMSASRTWTTSEVLVGTFLPT